METKFRELCEAIRDRKSLDKNGICNHAILRQLEQKDIPLLLEIAEVQNFALKKVKELFDTKKESEVSEVLDKAFDKIESLAATGNFAKWGYGDDLLSRL